MTEANELMRPIHDRMPVILAPEDWEAWLKMAPRDVHFLQALLEPYPDEGMDAWTVSTTVNNPRHDSPECVDPV
jgi:putative SOS response-associated peptidase YedK